MSAFFWPHLQRGRGQLGIQVDVEPGGTSEIPGVHEQVTGERANNDRGVVFPIGPSTSSSSTPSRVERLGAARRRSPSTSPPDPHRGRSARDTERLQQQHLVEPDRRARGHRMRVPLRARRRCVPPVTDRPDSTTRGERLLDGPSDGAVDQLGRWPCRDCCHPFELRRGPAARARTRGRSSVRVSSANSRPSAAGSPSHRAMSTRRMCPWLNSATAPSAATACCDHGVGPRPHLRSRSRRRGTARPDRPARDGLADLRGRDALVVAVVPLAQVVVDLGVGTETGEIDAVSRAHAAAGSTSTSAKSPSWSRAAAARAASRRPASVSGMSVRPVWRPFSLHSVAPCRMSTTSFAISSSLMPRPVPWSHAALIETR